MQERGCWLGLVKDVPGLDPSGTAGTESQPSLLILQSLIDKENALQ